MTERYFGTLTMSYRLGYPPPGPRNRFLRGAGSLTLQRLTLLAELREQARAAGKFGAAISAEHKRGQALGFYVHRSESGKAGDFTAGMTVEELIVSWRS
jgi:hypothetical protein